MFANSLKSAHNITYYVYRCVIQLKWLISFFLRLLVMGHTRIVCSKNRSNSAIIGCTLMQLTHNSAAPNSQALYTRETGKEKIQS